MALAVLTGALPAADDPERLGHYQTLDGTVGFVLDRSGELPLQRYDGSSEIIVLRPQAAARGDTVYRRADGTIVLRGTPYGALTYFARGDTAGSPLGPRETAAPLVPKERGRVEIDGLPRTLEQHMGLTYGRVIYVQAPAAERIGRQSTLNVLGDAMDNVRLALDRVFGAQDPAANGGGLDLRIIRFDLAQDEGVEFARDVLFVHVAPQQQLAGRPSSLEVYDALMRAREAQRRALSGIAAEASGKDVKSESTFDMQWER